MLQEEETKRVLLTRSQTQLFDLVRRVNSFPLSVNNHYREWGLYGNYQGCIREKTELEITRHLKKEIKARRKKNANRKGQREKIKLPLISMPSSKTRRLKESPISSPDDAIAHPIQLPPSPDWSCSTLRTAAAQAQQEMTSYHLAHDKRSYFSGSSHTHSQEGKPILIAPPPKVDRRGIITIYVCSSGLDFEVESRALRELVVPKLRDFCLPFQKDVHLIDLLWGNEDDLCNTHDMDDMMKAEYWSRIINTMGGKNDNSGSAFYEGFVVALLGQRYGEPSLPSQLSLYSFEKIAQFVQSENQRWNDSAVVETDASLIRASPPTNVQQQQQNGIDKQEASRQLSTTKVRFANGEEEVAPVAASKPSPPLETTTSTLSMNTKKNETLDMTILKQLYELRGGAYRLKPIKSIVPDFGKADEDRGRQARSIFITLRRRAIEFLLLYLDSATSEDDIALKEHFKKSTFHRDLEKFVLHSKIDKSKCLILHRKLFRLENVSSDEGAMFYLDTVNKLPKADVMFQELKETIENEIPYANQRFYRPSWRPGGVSPSVDGEHRSYISSLVNDVTEFVTESLTKSMVGKGADQKRAGESKLKKEFSYQFLFHPRQLEKPQSSLWIHQQEILWAADTFLESSTKRNKQLLLIHGPEGIGITTTLEHWLVNQTDRHPEYLFFYVRLGLSDAAYDIAATLARLCQEVYSKGKLLTCRPEQLILPKAPSALAWKLMHYLANVEQEVVIVMDSLDYLHDKDEMAGTKWIPPKFPENVKMILSTSRPNHLKALQKQHPSFLTASCQSCHEADLCFERFAALHPNLSFLCSGESGSGASDSTITKQREALLEYSRLNPSPLFIQITAEVVLRWDVSNVALPTLNGTMKQVLTLYFSLLERDLGEPVVRRGLGYITACRYGLSEGELLDVFTCDKFSMDYCNAQTRAKFSKTYFPALHWWRIFLALRSFLYIDLQGKIHWRHSVFQDVTRERYFLLRDRAQSYHQVLADYFANKFSGKPGTQPQTLILKTKNLHGSRTTFNLRKLQELPHHLVHSQQGDRVKRECIFHVEFSQAFIQYCGVQPLAEYLEMMANFLPEDKEVPLYQQFLDTVGELLMSNSLELPCQFVSRLRHIIEQGQTGNPPPYPNLTAMLLKVTASDMVPHNFTLNMSHTKPKKVLFLPESDSPGTTCVALAEGGNLLAAVTNSSHFITIWDLRDTVVISMMTKRNSVIHEMMFVCGDELLLTSETACVSTWNVKEGTLVQRIAEDLADPCSLGLLSNREVVALISPGTCKVGAFGLRDAAAVSGAMFEYPDHSLLGIHQDKTLLGARESGTDKLLLALRGHNEALVTCIPSAKGEWKEVFRLKCLSPGTSIETVATTESYYIVGGNFMTPELLSKKLVCFDLFDVERGRFIRRIRGCGQDSVEHPVYIEAKGLYSVCIGYSCALQRSHVSTYNLETEEHKHLANNMSSGGKRIMAHAFRNMAEFVTVEEGQESRVSLWNMAVQMKESSVKIVPKHSWMQLKLMRSAEDSVQQIVGIGEGNKEVAIFKVQLSYEKDKKVVSIEKETNFEQFHDTFSGSDVILNHLLLPGASENPKAPLIVLTDCKFSHIMQDCKQVYQLVKFFDLEQGKLLNRLKDVFIIPSRLTEYHLFEEKTAAASLSGSTFDSLLSDENMTTRSAASASSFYLLGLSENRSHFVCWNLNLGQAAWRMRTDFRETEQKRFQLERLASQRFSTSSRFDSEQLFQRSVSLMSRNVNAELKAPGVSSVEQNFPEEKDNCIENYLLSADGQLIFASFHAHFLAVFDISQKQHVYTLVYKQGLLLLNAAALSHQGNFLLQSVFNEQKSRTEVLLWDVGLSRVRKVLKNVSDVGAVALSEDATVAVIAMKHSLRVWRPLEGKKSAQRHLLISCPPCINITEYKRMSADGTEFLAPKLQVLSSQNKVLLVWRGFYLWDLLSGQLVGCFSLFDVPIVSFTLCHNNTLLVYATKNSTLLHALSLTPPSPH